MNGMGAAVARAIGAAAATASFFIFALALPPAAFGIWFQTEPVTTGLLVTGAVCALCLPLLELTGHPVGSAICRRPMLLLGAFVLWNAAASAFQAFPARSWFGTPETGEGVLCYAALWVHAVLAMTLWPHRWPRRAIATAAALAALLMAGLVAGLPTGSAWRPQLVAGYAGAVGPAVLLIVVGSVVRPNRWIVALGLLVALPVVLLSVVISPTDGRLLNRSAILFACVLGPLLFPPLRFVLLRLSARSARVSAALIPLVAPALLSFLLLVSVSMPGVTAVYSLRSRALLVVAAFRGLSDDAAAWLGGTGWGSYNDLLFRHTYLATVSGFRDGVWNPDWEAIGAGAFDSHSAVIESLTGGGIPAALLYLLTMCTIVYDTRRPLLAGSAVTWTLILASLCVWYPFLLSFPFLAAAIAAAVAPVRPSGRRGFRVWPSLVSLALAGVLAAGAWATYQDAQSGGRLLAMLNRQDPAEAAAFGGQPDDHGRGGVHLWWAALNYAAFISERTAAHQPLSDGQVAWYEKALHEVDRWAADGRAGLRLTALTAAIRNDLMSAEDAPALNAMRAHEAVAWPGAVMRVVTLAPERTDIAAPYLTWLAGGQHFLPVLAFCGRLFSLRPTDPVCLWYGGYAMLSDPMTDKAGILQMRDGIRAGVERVAPVTAQARDSVNAQAAALEK